MKDKKKQNVYTAKERKELRRTGEVSPRAVPDEPDEPLSDAGIDGTKARFPRKSKWLLAGAIFMAVVLITFSILIPVVFMPMYAYRDVENPVAVLRLSNGDSIEFEIFEKEVPYSATNFLYLAQKGFFDDTIIFDTTNQYVRFGQYEDAAYTAYRTTNEKFLTKVTEITIPNGTNGKPMANSPLDYRISRDSYADTAKQYADKANQLGYLSQLYALSGTEFQICGETGEPLNVPNKDESASSVAPKNMSGYVFGRCLNEDSFDTVRRIAQMEQNKDNNHAFWSAPSQTIKIKKIDLYKMDYWGKWRTFNWDNYFKDHITWYNGSGIVKPKS